MTPSETPKKLLMASALPTFQALSRAGWIIRKPMTPPRKMLPPKTRAAEIATRTGSMTNAVLATRSRKLNQSLWPKAGQNLGMASTIPIIRPEATMAGRMGTNTSPGVLRIFFQSGMREAAAALTSALLAAVSPVTAKNSS